jgi:ATP-dependent phosphofructokinase / diphosphate-dependent phosphofructokinase
MKRIAVLTAGGDTPALNATISGVVERANQLKIEVFGIIKGFNGLLNPEVPHVHLNPLYTTIPELDPTLGGTILGASRDYISGDDKQTISIAANRLSQLKVDGLVCIGGDGTLNGMQALADLIPVVLAPKTIDNDLGLNYLDEQDEWIREEDTTNKRGFKYKKRQGRSFSLDEMINYATPGYATAVFVSSSNVQRIRTTAESHRRIAIIEVMGRDCGMIALGTAYGQPDMILLPESPVEPEPLVQKLVSVLDYQKHAVVVVSEGIVDKDGLPYGSVSASKDPAGNIQYTGAAEAIKRLFVQELGNDFFTRKRRNESADAAIFTRKIGHTQRGGRPILFDRYHAQQLGGKSVDLLVEGKHNVIATLQYRDQAFCLDNCPANTLRDRWGTIHARPLASAFYDSVRFKPSALGNEYLHSIFHNALSEGDIESSRSLFDSAHLNRPYHSVNVDVNKRIRRLAKVD